MIEDRNGDVLIQWRGEIYKRKDYNFNHKNLIKNLMKGKEWQKIKIRKNYYIAIYAYDICAFDKDNNFYTEVGIGKDWPRYRSVLNPRWEVIAVPKFDYWEGIMRGIGFVVDIHGNIYQMQSEIKRKRIHIKVVKYKRSW